MACLLSARGKAFKVDAFLEDSNLKPHAVWRKGEPLSSVPTSRDKKQQYSGFSVIVSRFGRDNFPGQLREAIAFVRRNHAELKRLRKARGLSELWLEFGVLLRSDIAVHVDCFPEDLVEVAGRIPMTLSVSHYSV